MDKQPRGSAPTRSLSPILNDITITPIPKEIVIRKRKKIIDNEKTLVYTITSQY